jgi:alcohol dehydrogenase class IV
MPKMTALIPCNPWRFFEAFFYPAVQEFRPVTVRVTIMRFEFATATKIVFGPGSIHEAVSAAASLGSRALIVAGKATDRLDSFISELRARGLECTLFSTLGEPTVPRILEGVAIAKNAGCDIAIGCGGGSALDGAKAIAALVANPGDPLDYLEVVGRGNQLSQPCLPCICIPTTAGAGSEVTRNAVLASPERRVKVSLRSPRMFPLLAVVDPDLTHSLPAPMTAGTGMDALTQLIEPFISNNANPLVDALCRDGIRRVALWLRPAYYEGGNAQARENMALASLFGGIALTNAGLGAVHGFAAPLGGMFPIPHGIACARLLPYVMEANCAALSSRAKDSPEIARYDEIARLLTGRSTDRAKEGVACIHSMCSEFLVPPLADFGVAERDLPAIAEKALRSSSMKSNPIQLTLDVLISILKQAL